MEDSHMYSLNNSNNYNYELGNSSVDIFKIFGDIINSYITGFNKSTSIQVIYTKNITLYHYLYDKGIDTIAHIFKILLINTKNIDLVKYYCIKSINYYIEFIEQNNTQADDKIKYTHASVFSYVNTIYKLNKSYRKTSVNILDEEWSIFKNIELMISLYSKQIVGETHTQETHTQEIHTQALIENNLKFMANIIELYQDDDELVHKLNFVIDFITLTNLSSITSINILLTHVKERSAIILNKSILLKKILSADEKINDEEDYVKWLLL
jgi:hypothetical protein